MIVNQLYLALGPLIVGTSGNSHVFLDFRRAEETKTNSELIDKI